MPKQTQSARITAALLADGFVKTAAQTSRKHERYQHPTKHPAEIYVFVGQAGSVRVGKTYTSSTPINAAWKRRLLGEVLR